MFGKIAGWVVALTLIMGLAPARQQEIPAPIDLLGEQRANIQAYYPLSPGVYELRPVHIPQKNLCLAVDYPADSWVMPYVFQINCGVRPNLALIPASFGELGKRNVYTLRATDHRGSDGKLDLCATIARGVWVGTPRIDMLPCAGGYWAAEDQLFRVSAEPTPRGEITLSLSSRQYPCGAWDVTDTSTQVMAPIQFFRCHFRANQRFRITYRSPLDRADIPQSNGWFAGPAGQPMRRARPVQHVDIPGGDYVSAPASAVEECAARCAADARCRAFSWTSQYVSQGPNMCWLKDQLGQSHVTPGVWSGYVWHYDGVENVL